MRGLASCKRGSWLLRSGALLALLLLALTLPTAATAQTTELSLPEVNVIGTSPLSSSRPARPSPAGGGAPRRAATGPAAPAAPAQPSPGTGQIDRNKVPSATVTLTAEDFTKAPTLADALLQQVPSVYVNDNAGNPFQPDVQYRGFLASPVVGVPQGLAVYQNGVRVNEAFGDTVNWDFISEKAIRRLDVLPSNPIFGLNALGGAIAIEMKNGFNYRGGEAEVLAGSYWRRSAAAQVGLRKDNVAAYLFVDALNDNGWRDRSPSELRRFYGDIGILGDNSELHLSFTGASNFFGATAAAPSELLDRRWNAVYTTPQTYKNQLAFLNATGSYQLSDTLALKGNAYFRGFWQKHVDGNTSDVVPCVVPAGFLCLEDDTNLLFGTTGPVPNFLAGATPGTVDRTSTSASSWGGSLQATSTSRILGRDNNLVIGASLDRGHVNFRAASELGTIGPDLFVTGTGVTIAQPDGAVTPANLKTSNTYLGLYVTDTFDVTPRLSITAGGRFNLAQVELADQLGTALNGSHRFTRFNPVIGATFKVTPELNAYAGHSQANRAPTPAELACADPARPCLLDNFLVADPPLKQVVARTFEAGLRGRIALGTGNLAWNLGAFHTTSEDDIIHVASPVTGRGFFQNAGTTLRQGIEASGRYQADRWNVYASYNYIAATFEDTLTLLSPGNPFAVDGLITVRPGNVIPSIPAHRFKAGAEYALKEKWKVGADVIGVSGQYFRGDESNLNPMLPGYWLVNLRSSYQVTKDVEVFALVQNLFNRRYTTFGAFFETNEVPFLGLTDPRTVSPGVPLAAYAGVRSRF
jgi:iron complex outermembrane receptor protein